MPTAKALALEQKVQDAGSMPAGMVSMPFTVNVPRAEGSSKPKRDVGTEQDTKKGQCTSNACVACGATASKHCAACGTVKYCSRECQTSHWKEHKAACRAAAPREADEWTESNRWAKGLKISDRYEWLCNCYQMRCDDDYTWGGGQLHGPYDPEGDTATIAEDFLTFCLLAVRTGVIPKRWDWAAFLQVAKRFVVCAFEKSDAQERWGSENVFAAAMGGRSLRWTATKVYGSEITEEEESEEHRRAQRDSHKARRVWHEDNEWDTDDEDDYSDEDHRSDDGNSDPEELGELDEPCDAVGGPTHTFGTFDSVGGSALWVKLEEEMAAQRHASRRY